MKRKLAAWATAAVLALVLAGSAVLPALADHDGLRDRVRDLERAVERLDRRLDQIPIPPPPSP